jgi:hypothetical protein
MKDRNDVCMQCRGVLVAGEPLNGKDLGDGRILWRCRHCVEIVGRAFWPSDDDGPYPGTITHPYCDVGVGWRLH